MRKEKRWVVRRRDGATVGQIVVLAREELRAIDEGRVFVGRRRVTSKDEPVKEGDEVRIGAPRDTEPSVEILLEREGLVACVKPAGIPTVPDHAGAAQSLVALVARAVGKRAADLRVTSRLDRDVSGVVVFALDEAAEARLRTARAEGKYVRRYVAVACARHEVGLHEGEWTAPIGRGRDPLHRAVGGPDAKESRTRFAVVAVTSTFALLGVAPETGRTHQIRVHASDAGMPLFGDPDYGGPRRVTLPDGRVVELSRIALHAARVRLPDGKGELVVSAPIPPALAKAWIDLGGSGDAWDTAVTCNLPA